MKLALLFATLLPLTLIPQPVYAADPAKKPGNTADTAFVKKAAEGGMMEVKLGEMAKEKASRQDVKDFGSLMIQDHSRANAELMALAKSKDITVPQDLKGKAKSMTEHLSKLSGPEFDKAYVDHMVSDHEKDVKEFEDASKTAADPDVRAFAEKTLPVLKTHLEKIRGIQAAK